jgi:hypothetical protein
MSNHLIIGLGGTGGKVIRNIRKAIYRDWRPTVSDVGSGAVKQGIDKVSLATPLGLKIDYLFVDSSKEHMGFDDPDWKILGENLQLDPAGQCHLKGSDLKNRLDDIHSYPALAPWIGRTQDWGPIMNLGGGGAEILGGQKRRLGRLLFAGNADSFMERVNKKANQLKSGAHSASITFHIIAGLAGGTGSGCLIDSIALIRNEYRDAKQYPIILYVLLPDEYPMQNWNTGNYHANGYAALKELNALGAGQYLPYNLRGYGERYKALESPFKICYLITNENSYGAPFEVDKQIPELIAEMLYQKLVAGIQGASKQIGRMVEWENMEISHEGKSRNGGSERCRLFASFGIKKISYPEDIIRDYIGFSLSAQTLNQMLYNNWAQGYLGQPVDMGIEGLIADTTYQKLVNLDRDVFYLERQFSTDEIEKDQKHWKSFEAEWKAYIERVSADIISEKEGNWLESLKRKCEDREKKAFRDSRGIVDYFSWKQDRVAEYAKMIAGGIEAKLGEELISGKRSLTEIDSILKSLCSLLERNMATWDKQRVEDEILATRERVGWAENIQRYEDMGAFARKMTGSNMRIFEAGKLGMTNYFVLKTRVIASEFASLFINKVRHELIMTKDHVVNTISAFNSAVRQCVDRANELKPEEGKLGSNEVVMRLFNGDEVTRYMSSLTGNRIFQDKQARHARQAMTERLMQGRSDLRYLPTNKDNGNLLDILARSSHATLSTFDATAEIAATGDGSEASFGRLLSVSIIDKLRERYRGDTEIMKKEIRDYMSKAGYLLRISDSQHEKKGPGTDFSGQNKRANLIVMMPNADSDDDFVKELRRAFESSVADSNSVQFIDTGDTRRHEITILSFVQLFPLRYVAVLEKLKEKYEARLKDGDAKQRLLEIHTEGTTEDFPELYVPPVRDIVGPTLLLALSLGTVKPKTVAGNEGTINGSLVTNDDLLTDLGVGFDGALQKCSIRDILDRVYSLNHEKCQSIKADRVKVEELKGTLKTLSREIAAGNDDELREMIRYEKLAESELEGHLSAKS